MENAGLGLAFFLLPQNAFKRWSTFIEYWVDYILLAVLQETFFEKYTYLRNILE